MAGEDNAAAEPRPGEFSQDQEKGQVVSETERQQTERVAPQEMPQERATKPIPPLPQEREIKPSPPLPQERETKPSPPLPPRPLPATHTDSLKQQPLPPVPQPLPQGVHFGPLPIEESHETDDFVRPFSPGWQKTSLILGGLSLISSAVIFAMGVAIGFVNAPYYEADSSSPIDIEFGAMGSAAGLAILVIMVENLMIVFSSRHQGMHPGALVAYHLIIWLLAVVGVIVTAMFNSTSARSWYNYPRNQEGYLSAQVSVYEQVLLAFGCILLLVHFILFVGSCVMTNRLNNAKRKVVIVRVPAPGGYPGGQHPAYGSRQPFMSHPGAQSGQYPVPLIAQIPPGPGDGTGPAPPSQAVLYGGYYAPAPQSMAWATSQQPGNPGQWQGYCAPNPVSGRTSNNPARYSQRAAPAPALASSSGSRRSQRQSQAQAERQPQAPVQPTAPQEQQPRTEEPVSEKTT